MAGEGAPTWEAVARSHGRFLYTVAYRLTGNREDAQDLVQEVLLRVRRGLVTYQPGSMEGWLSRITTNAFLDEVRRRRRRPVVALPTDPDRVIPPSPSADEVLAAAALPADVQAPPGRASVAAGRGRARRGCRGRAGDGVAHRAVAHREAGDQPASRGPRGQRVVAGRPCRATLAGRRAVHRLRVDVHDGGAAVRRI